MKTMLIYSYNTEQFPLFPFAVYMRENSEGKTGEIPSFLSLQAFHIFSKQMENICADCKTTQLNFNIQFCSLLSYRIVIFPGEFSSTKIFHCILYLFNIFSTLVFHLHFCYLIFFNVYIT